VVAADETGAETGAEGAGDTASGDTASRDTASGTTAPGERWNAPVGGVACRDIDRDR
jgi:hypothetical protein